MNVRTFDASGDFRSDLLYQLHIPLAHFGIEDELETFRRRNSEGLVVAPLETKEPFVYAEAWASEKLLYECPISNEHLTGGEEKEFIADLVGGPVVPDFVHDHYGIELLVTERIANALSASGLTGWKATAIEVRVNQSRVPDVRLYRVQFSGADCHRKPITHIPPDDKNSCSNCGRGPIVCPHCKDTEFKCPQCKQRLIFMADSPEAATAALTADRVPIANRIVDGARWDGSDFVKFPDIGLISHKALSFFQSIHATNFIAEPCRVDARGMDRR
jgi:hypothetical protein